MANALFFAEIWMSKTDSQVCKHKNKASSLLAKLTMEAGKGGEIPSFGLSILNFNVVSC